MLIRRLLIISALACVFLTGCKHGRHRRDDRPICTPPRGQTIPPTAIPAGPPIPLPPVERGVEPAGNAELLLPQAPPGKTRSDYVAPGGNRNSAVLAEPDVAYPPPTTDVGDLTENKPTPAKPEMTNPIADFVQVKDGVGTGRRPDLDGLDWLKSAGYKTVVFLRGQNDDDTTDRQQVERRGMRFVSILATPEGLTQQWLDEFNNRVGDVAARPMFVYSRDEGIAGAAWYLHLRTAEFFTHDEARVRAGRLGLKDETTDMYRAALKLVPPAK
ncbi:MAG TPA: hypothetical protein VM597_20955 [Gemmataceae bacterium]|jgi:protein tyrosine phosphatase (PTP) superfamily phosphohydrolase (DUF442 family)|nr:hypothetical protein [Gemmataceae bacterium]